MALKLSSGMRSAQLTALKTAFANGILCLYSGTQPDDADRAENGTLLCKITLDGEAFVAGAPDNGLNFDTTMTHDALYTKTTMKKPTADTWKGTALVTGTIGWGRFYANAFVTGASTTAVRFDVTAAVSGGQLTLSTSQATAGADVSVDQFNYNLNSYRR